MQALHDRVRQPTRLGALALQMLQVAGEHLLARGYALSVQAWHFNATGQRVECQATTMQAVDALRASGEPRGHAHALDLLSLNAMSAGRFDEAITLALEALDVPGAVRLPAELALNMSRLGGAHAYLGKFDEALRWFYRAIDQAEASGDEGLQASVLSIVGAVQFSLHNREDGDLLSERAWRLLQGGERNQLWGLVTINRLSALMLTDRNAQALPLVEAYLEVAPSFNVLMQAKCLMAAATVLAHLGQTDRAQRLLDDGVARHQDLGAPASDGAWLQAMLWNQTGRHTEALALCSERLSQSDAPDAKAPVSRARLHTEAVRACEALGELAQALRWYRELAATERLLSDEAARSRRLTLQIQFELQTAQRARDAALQREREAEHERALLAELNQRLADANLAKTRFLAAASHDLRQPIHALGLQLAHLGNCRSVSETQGVTQRMGRAIASLTTMFDTLLDISRMDAGVVTPRLQQMAMRPFLARLVEEFLPVAQAAGLRLALWLPQSTGAVLHTHSDPALLERVVRNVLANALKYTAQGAVLVALRQRAGQLSLEVWDSGAGIADSERERIFDEFYQVGVAARAHSDGLGLGLSIVRRLSVLLDHPVSLASRLGQGTRFRILLPTVVASRSVQGPTSGPPSQTTEPALHALRSLHVAVIEDDADVRDSIVALLQRWGHRVDAGACADELLGQWPAGSGPDAVVADYRLQGARNGCDEVQALARALGRQPATLIVTGETAPETLRLLAASGLPWLSKPLQPARLRSWLAGVCELGDG